MNNKQGSPAKAGFTLIELLVVVAIIGLLASVVVVSLGGARVGARDARRAGDVAQLRTALELYASDNNGSYPATLTLLTPNYIPAVPNDPTDIAYTYCLDTTKGRGYGLGIALEDEGSSIMGGSVALDKMPGTCTTQANWSEPSILCEVGSGTSVNYCVRS